MWLDFHIIGDIMFKTTTINYLQNPGGFCYLQQILGVPKSPRIEGKHLHLRPILCFFMVGFLK